MLWAEILIFTGSIGVVEWLAHQTLYYEVAGLNPAGGRMRIQLMTLMLHCIEPVIIILPSSQYDLNNVERDVKHQIII